METLTLLIAAVASLLVLFMPPAQAFAVYIITLLAYPSFLVVRLGPLDISAGRIVVAVLLLRCLTNTKLIKNFKWCRLDSWMIFMTLIGVAIPLFSRQQSLMRILENRSGFLVDTLFAYFAARYCITSLKSMTVAIKWIALALIPLACLGVIEAHTGWQPFAALKQYCPWVDSSADSEKAVTLRFGFTRAVGPLAHPILFGVTFMMFLPLIYYLRNEKGIWGKLSYLLCGIAIVGTISSMSSGAWAIALVTIVCLIMEHYKRWVKPLVISMLLSFVAISALSNRPFYHVIFSRANPVKGASWHRARLIDKAIENFDEWWLIGYGGRKPNWGKSLGMTWTDITNEYITFGTQYGVLGIIALCGLLTSSILKLRHLFKSTIDPKLRSLYWAFGSIIAALIISFNGFTIFGQTYTLFFCILGMIGSSSNTLVTFPAYSYPFNFQTYRRPEMPGKQTVCQV